MALYELEIPPEQDGYGVQLGQTTVETILDGGLPRVRADQLDVAHRVTVRWSVGRNGYKYLMAFYRKGTNKGSQPFIANLIIDHPDLEPYTCYFVAGSFKLESQKGLTYVISAEVWATPNAAPSDDQENLDLGLFEAPEA